MKLSIVVLNYKTKNLVKYFLADVLKFEFPWSWEIIVVDNDSHDDIQAMLAKDFPVVKFAANPKNVGMGAGNNAGIKLSRGDYVLIANPDITLNQSAITNLVEFLNSHASAGIVAPQILNPDKTVQPTCFRWPHFFTFLYRRTFLGATQKGKQHLSNFLYNYHDIQHATQVDWVLGGCFLVRRRALDQVGLFDQRFFLFLEDTDLCRRMWQKDWSIWYLPQAKIIHLPHRLSAGQGSLADLFSRLTWIHLSSWLKYFLKWKGHGLPA